ncbi:iron uptake transporter deferrochelatase/peroxidase subunit [Gorillibacterium sp. sgz5001074]|uniref:iron uptake transporter deferrochelatase/peroxidase subunit n=1 Tax=Gorillibacterium sp. sgz5001074 TaxID=3446695 RepID=UPI003F67F93D
MGESGEKRMFEQPLSRRDALKLAGMGGLGLLLGAGGGAALAGVRSATASKPEAGGAGDVIPFYGPVQAGIVTPAQDFVCLGAFDLTAADIGEVRQLFQAWTRASARLVRGEGAGEESGNSLLPPADTGEAMGLLAAKTSITFGLGVSFFDQRYGLAAKKPKELADLPPFGGDELRPEWSGGDVVVQVCAGDPQVAFHALRNLTRIARGKAVLRWVQEGFQRTGAADPKGATPRNLMGFKDGTNNPDVSDKKTADEVVWVQPSDGPGWMAGGSYMVMRRIRMRIEVWDRTTLADQEATFGRHRVSGAPLGAHNEFDPVEPEKKDAKGKPLMPADSHVALAHMDGKVRIHRRGYSYSNGVDLKTGQLDAGLLFICYNRTPSAQFIPMQAKLGAMDALNEYIVHVGSGLYACLPGVKEGGYIGDTLF